MCVCVCVCVCVTDSSCMCLPIAPPPSLSPQVMMVEERRWPLGNKTVDLHGGYGVISTIKWKENLIAWANEKVGQ